MSENISIFIPAFNASKTICETLEGVNQSALFAGMIIPVYIYDDCSLDDTFMIINSYNGSNIELYVYKNLKNLGERGTINLAFENLATKFNWVLIIHADDIPKKEWIKIIYEVIDECGDKNVFSIWSSYDCFEESDKNIHPGDNEGSIVRYQRQLKDGKFYLTKITSSWHVSGAAINLGLFKTIGRFDPFLAQYGDTEFYAKAMIKGFNDIYIRRTLTKYRVLSSSVSFVSKKTNRDIKEMFYIINKYSNILTKNEKRKILHLALEYSFKRSIKSILKGDLKSFFKAVFLTFSSLTKY